MVLLLLFLLVVVAVGRLATNTINCLQRHSATKGEEERRGEERDDNGEPGEKGSRNGGRLICQSSVLLVQYPRIPLRRPPPPSPSPPLPFSSSASLSSSFTSSCASAAYALLLLVVLLLLLSPSRSELSFLLITIVPPPCWHCCPARQPDPPTDYSITLNFLFLLLD